eukprot:2927967-Lingulodinium_polyedra.AAC.1
MVAQMAAQDPPWDCVGGRAPQSRSRGPSAQPVPSPGAVAGGLWRGERRSASGGGRRVARH